jgi:4-hydroxybenzoate polyprenyltransferase
VILTGALLIYEHSLVKANDLSKLNAAFFTTNGLISVMLLGFVVADRVVQRM